MPSGRNISKEVRNLIYKKVTRNYTNKEIFDDVLSGETDIMSYKTLQKHANHLRNATEDEVRVFLDGANTFKPGRKRIMSDFDEQLFMIPFVDAQYGKSQSKRLRVACAEFTANHYRPDDVVPSIRTLQRVPGRYDWTRKIVDRVHRNRDDNKRLDFMRTVAPFDPSTFVDIDETPFNREEVEEKHGYSPRGETAHRTQLILNGKNYSIISALTPHGFLAWAVYDIAITADIVVEFLTNRVRPLLPPGSFGLFDNASIHKKEEAWECIDGVFEGMWAYSSPYSPDLKPIERAFGLVKNKLKELEYEALLHPIPTINRVFDMFSVRGPEGHLCNEYFNHFRRNHESWLESLE